VPPFIHIEIILGQFYGKIKINIIFLSAQTTTNGHKSAKKKLRRVITIDKWSQICKKEVEEGDNN
jgi:hypothetical protein